MLPGVVGQFEFSRSHCDGEYCFIHNAIIACARAQTCLTRWQTYKLGGRPRGKLILAKTSFDDERKWELFMRTLAPRFLFIILFVYYYYRIFFTPYRIYVYVLVLYNVCVRGIQAITPQPRGVYKRPNRPMSSRA